MTGTKKMPPPMTLEITMAAASSGTEPTFELRTNAAEISLQQMKAIRRLEVYWREQLARQVELADLHPLRRAVLGEDVHAHVLELASSSACRPATAADRRCSRPWGAPSTAQSGCRRRGRSAGILRPSLLPPGPGAHRAPAAAAA